MLVAPSRKMYRSTLTTENEKSDFSVVPVKAAVNRFSRLKAVSVDAATLAVNRFAV